MAKVACLVPLVSLEKTKAIDICHLGTILWSWTLCENCEHGKHCMEGDCPSMRSKSLKRFFDYYMELLASHEPIFEPSKRPVLSQHVILRIVSELKSQPRITRLELARKIFASHTAPEQQPTADQEQEINLAVKAMTMISCSMQNPSSSLLEQGMSIVPWRNDVPFCQFITDIFPRADHPTISQHDLLSSLNMRTALMAKKLKKHAGLTFRPTNDLRSHLKLDRKNHVVEIYHHTAFLKEHLRLTKNKSLNMSVEDSLRLCVSYFIDLGSRNLVWSETISPASINNLDCKLGVPSHANLRSKLLTQSKRFSSQSRISSRRPSYYP